MIGVYCCRSWAFIGYRQRPGRGADIGVFQRKFRALVSPGEGLPVDIPGYGPAAGSQ
jgi:hypothetical protein